MRIWIAVTACSACFAAFLIQQASGQVVVLTNGSLPATAGVVIGGTPGTADATFWAHLDRRSVPQKVAAVVRWRLEGPAE